MTLKPEDQSFSLQLANYPAKHIAAAIGCSLPTAYDWRSGRRKPAKWLQTRYIEDIKNYCEQMKLCLNTKDHYTKKES